MAETEGDGGPREQRTWAPLDAVFDLGRSIPWQAFAAVGVLVYGFLRMVYGLFYGSFHVRPEEVGFGYTDTLAQSAAAVLLVSLVGLVLIQLGVFWLLFYALRTITQPLVSLFTRVIQEVREDRWKQLLAWLAHRLAILIIFFGAVVLGRRLESWWFPIGGGLLIAWLFEIGARIPNPLRRDLVPVDRPASPRELGNRFGWMFVIFVLLLLGPVLIRSAIDDATDAKNGLAIPASGRLLGVFPPWSAQPVRVFWITADKAPDTLSNPKGHCVMYLGRANDITVVYDLDFETDPPDSFQGRF